MKATGENIKKRCEAQKISPDELARFFNLDLSTPYYWFQGKSLPRWELAFNLADILSCRLEDLFVLESDEE
jgi:DNA-binding XRE family transcriptional regulator